jgi:hypothetical protein
MEIVVEGPGSVPLILPESSGAGSWFGPPSLPKSLQGYRFRERLDAQAGELPPLRQMVVPGDRVAIALDPLTPGWPELLDLVVERLRAGGVEAESIRVIATSEFEAPGHALPRDVSWTVHEPASRSDLAYLAATRGGRRIYLNRHLTDADLVVAIGALERSPLRMFGGPWAREAIVGPWSVVYPGLTDAPTRDQAFALSDQAKGADTAQPHAGGDRESREVGKLLGSLYEIGVIPGAGGGVHDVLAGTLHGSSSAREAVRDAWRFTRETTADLVIARIGRSGQASGWTELVAGVLSALRLVRGGGTLVAYCALDQAPGPAVAALATAEEVRPRAALRGLGEAPDFVLARSLSDIPPAWHVALGSGLDRDTVEGLGFIALEGVATSQRLVDAAGSCVFIDRPEITGIRVTETS